MSFKWAKLLLLLALSPSWALRAGHVAPPRASNTRPNIIFIFTDDQDKHMNSLDYMKGVQTHLVSQGVTYENHFCTVALCCPSRVNLWTGRTAHNTNVTGLSPPYGGYPKFIEQGFNDDWLPVWMQQAGYQTYYVGKLMNSYAPDNYNKPFVKGFNGSDFLCGPGTYNYYNPVYQRNQDKPKKYENQYTTDLLWNKSLGFLNDARNSDQPFFLTMATVAPHSGGGPRPPGNYHGGPVPKLEYAYLFNDTEVPRTENFNPEAVSGTSWLLNLTRLNNSRIEANDEYYRNRLRALQSVDDVVNNTFAYLEEHKLLDNTYVIYSTDNGFHISQHRLFPGKNCPYEEDVNIPLLIRGPGIKPNISTNATTSHTDLAATILYMAQAKIPDYLDGSPLPIVDPNPVVENFEHASIEHWGSAGSDEDFYPEAPGAINTTYKALRVIGPGYNYYYSVWCTNQHELYDMTKDPQQMHNLYEPYTYQQHAAASSSSNPYNLNRLESRLDALMLVLKSCKAQTCMKPWLALHPGGAVTNLPEAMDAKYDQFYEEQQQRVSYNWCDQGYIIAAEGPQNFVTYQAS